MTKADYFFRTNRSNRGQERPGNSSMNISLFYFLARFEPITLIWSLSEEERPSNPDQRF